MDTEVGSSPKQPVAGSASASSAQAQRGLSHVPPPWAPPARDRCANRELWVREAAEHRSDLALSLILPLAFFAALFVWIPTDARIQYNFDEGVNLIKGLLHARGESLYTETADAFTARIGSYWSAARRSA